MVKYLGNMTLQGSILAEPIYYGVKRIAVFNDSFVISLPKGSILSSDSGRLCKIIVVSEVLDKPVCFYARVRQYGVPKNKVTYIYFPRAILSPKDLPDLRNQLARIVVYKTDEFSSVSIPASELAKTPPTVPQMKELVKQ